MATIGDGKLISRDFQVYFTSLTANQNVWDKVASEDIGLQEYIKRFNGSTIEYTLKNLLETVDGRENGEKIFYEFGVLRKDGFVSNLDDGDTVDTNTKGEILISQNGSITLTMVSLNKKTMTDLKNNDGNDICVLAVSEDDSILAFFYPDVRLNFNPSVTGGEIGTIEVTFNKDVACGSDWSIPFTTYVAPVGQAEEGE